MTSVMERWYRKRHPGKDVPYKYKYGLWTIFTKPIRKWFSAVLAPAIPYTGLRMWVYRRCGYKIGKGTFIGMHCYLDDVCWDLMEIGKNVTISYGVYFALHGRKQGHNRLIVRDGVYIGMRANIVARNDLEIGKGAIVGAGTLVNKSIPDGATAVGVPCRILLRADS